MLAAPADPRKIATDTYGVINTPGSRATSCGQPLTAGIVAPARGMPDRERLVSLDERRLRALIDAGESLVAERELEAVCDRLLRVARDVTNARYAAIGVLDESRHQLADFITLGIDDETREAIGELPRGRGVLGMLILHPEPARVDDVGKHPWSYGFPTGHPPMRSFLGVPILLRGEAWGNLYLTEKAGDGPFDAEDEETAVVLAAWAAIAIDNARLQRSGEQRRRELERSLNALKATTEIARAVGGETDLERVLELIAKRSRALVEARGLAILLAREDDFAVAATAGDVPPDAAGARVSRAGSVAGRVLASGCAERIDDLSSSIRFALSDLSVKATAGLFVPLRFRGLGVGVIEAFDRLDGPRFEPNDEELLKAAAASAATAVATAQSVERDRRRRTLQVADEERRRWARELHDETLQAMGGLRVLLSSGRRSEDRGTLESAVDQAIGQIADQIEDLRALITELRPAALDDLGLGPALETLFERMRNGSALELVSRVALPSPGDSEGVGLTPELETTAYRIVQESLTNVMRHAHAGTATVEVLDRDGRLRIIVRDDGQGFDPSERAIGFGLIGMRERVALANGTLEVTSSPRGTTVDVTLPCEHGTARTARALPGG
jgi:signal transduction histidine kinase